ncbi:hypothetical protein ACHAQH_003655 [Verticillium albo-atrum]
MNITLGVITAVQGLAANGLGRDIWTLPWSMLITFAKFFYVMQIMYFMHVPLLKTAMLFFFLQIFPDPLCQRLLRGTVAVNVVGGIAFLAVAVLQCLPVENNWERFEGSSSHGRCVNINAMGWANAVFNIILDIWMLVLPLTQVVKLSLHWKKKLGVALMFGVGTL